MLLVAPPYSSFVSAYDGMVGVEFFRRVRRAFETLARHYDIRFCSAADIGCGTGLFACYLNRCRGVPVYAVDKSPEMLRVAQCRCHGPGICFLQQDIRELCLPELVDLATANFDTVTPCHPLGGLRTYRRAHCTARHSMEQRVRWEPTQGLIRIRVLHQHSGCALPTVELHTERAYGPGDIGRGLVEAGFVIRGVHDEATLCVPRSCPPRMIVVAQKRARFARVNNN